MFGKSYKIFTLLGFEVKVDLSWSVIAVLITWSLATGVFPNGYESLSTATYWWMGVAGAIGLFLSIIFHELAHSIVARRYGIPMRGITLFIFGGVAQMDSEPATAKSEFFMAVAGPIASVVLALGFAGFGATSTAAGWPPAVAGVIGYLVYINFILAIFNLVPAFPLDGGRMLRATLWWWKKNIRWATRIASSIGSGFGFALIVLGVFSFVTGSFIAGLWWVLIGMFLRHAAQMSYQQLLLRKALEGEEVHRFMKKNPITVSPNASIRQFVDDFVYKYQHKMFPVVENDRLMGCVTTKQVKEIPQPEWSAHRIEEIAGRCSSENTIKPETDATVALSMMRKTGNSRLMVAENGHLLGVLALKDLLNFLSLKIDLEVNGASAS